MLRRGVEDAGEICCLRYGQLVCCALEMDVRCGRQAEGSSAKIYVPKVRPQDLVLTKRSLQLPCQQDFAYLAANRRLLAKGS